MATDQIMTNEAHSRAGVGGHVLALQRQHTNLPWAQKCLRRWNNEAHGRSGMGGRVLAWQHQHTKLRYTTRS